MGGLGSRLVHWSSVAKAMEDGGLDRLPWVIIGYYRLLSVTMGYLSVTVGYRRLLWVTYGLLKSDHTVTGARGAGVEKSRIAFGKNIFLAPIGAKRVKKVRTVN